MGTASRSRESSHDRDAASPHSGPQGATVAIGRLSGMDQELVDTKAVSCVPPDEALLRKPVHHSHRKRVDCDGSSDLLIVGMRIRSRTISFASPFGNTAELRTDDEGKFVLSLSKQVRKYLFCRRIQRPSLQEFREQLFFLDSLYIFVSSICCLQLRFEAINSVVRPATMKVRQGFNRIPVHFDSCATSLCSFWRSCSTRPGAVVAG